MILKRTIKRENGSNGGYLTMPKEAEQLTKWLNLASSVAASVIERFERAFWRTMYGGAYVNGYGGCGE